MRFISNVYDSNKFISIKKIKYKNMLVIANIDNNNIHEIKFFIKHSSEK